MASIHLDHVTKVYGDGTRAVDGLDLAIADGEFMVFVGPSGCGKTSALRMTAGLEDITDGTLLVDGEVMNDVPAKARDMAMIFQNYALYPHMNVFDNLAFGLKMRGVDQAEIRRRVNEAAGTLGLADMLKKRPRHLSGGQRQRVAMGRAIVRQPQAFLMDEPLSNLDAKLRVHMRGEIARLQRDLRVTTIYVTHDQSEAMTLGDRVCMLRGGLLQQVDPPQVVYDRPANLFVASFIGSPSMNLVEAELVDDAEGLTAVFGSHDLELDPALLADRPGLAAYKNRRLALGIRPEDIDVVNGAAPPLGRTLTVNVDLQEDMGAEVFLHFQIQAARVHADQLVDALGDHANGGTASGASYAPFIARVERGAPVGDGHDVRLAVDTSRLHFFDLQSGVGIYD